MKFSLIAISFDEQLGQLVANFTKFVNLHQQAVDRRAYELS